MKWKGRRSSDNVVDQRHTRSKKGIGLTGLILGAGVVYLLGGNPLTFLMQNSDTITSSISGGSSASVASEAKDDELKEFSAVVLADTEDVWDTIFSDLDKTYPEPEMILFRNRVQSACGSATSAVGPFYCPGNFKIYLDLSFFSELEKSLGAKGDFARAYVIAHEVGHHVQNVLGINQRVRRAQRSLGKSDQNKLSVKMELQADCFSGLWANQAQKMKQILEEGDIKEALNAANAIGDDTLQKRSGGSVRPDSFTHGSSVQRFEAFNLGYKTGSFESCYNNFKAEL